MDSLLGEFLLALIELEGSSGLGFL